MASDAVSCVAACHGVLEGSCYAGGDAGAAVSPALKFAPPQSVCVDSAVFQSLSRSIPSSSATATQRGSASQQQQSCQVGTPSCMLMGFLRAVGLWLRSILWILVRLSGCVMVASLKSGTLFSSVDVDRSEVLSAGEVLRKGEGDSSPSVYMGSQAGGPSLTWRRRSR